jgi:hypothetical protein
MIRFIFKKAILFTFFFIWIQSFSLEMFFLMKKKGVFPDDYRYGDLYGLSFLKKFKGNLAIQNRHKYLENQKTKSKVNLYILGDSFTIEERINKSDFNVNQLHQTHWLNSEKIKLDSSKRNVLVIETIERYAKERFTKDVRNIEIIQKNEVILKPSPIRKFPLIGNLFIYFTTNFSKEYQYVKIVFNSVKNYKFPTSTDIEKRLEITLFNYDFILPFREMKATINYTFFDRIEKQIILSKNHEHQFIYQEADSTNIYSSFYPLTHFEIDTMIFYANKTKQYYLDKGFKEVYLSIIPNRVSLLAPELGHYNHLVERVQNKPNLGMPILDIFHIYQQNPRKYFSKSDTHWSEEGRAEWLKMVNLALEK